MFGPHQHSDPGPHAASCGCGRIGEHQRTGPGDRPQYDVATRGVPGVRIDEHRQASGKVGIGIVDGCLPRRRFSVDVVLPHGREGRPIDGRLQFQSGLPDAAHIGHENQHRCQGRHHDENPQPGNPAPRPWPRGTEIETV